VGALQAGLLGHARHGAAFARQVEFKVGLLEAIARLAQRAVQIEALVRQGTGSASMVTGMLPTPCCVMSDDDDGGRRERRRAWHCAPALLHGLEQLLHGDGLFQKGNAPMRVASTAVSMVAWPLIMMTGMVRRPPAHSLSSVTPSVSGIQMSSSTRSYTLATRALRAWVAFSPVHAVPSSFRISDSKIPDPQFVVDHQNVCHE
jgi:hypothetical protein